MSIEKLAKKQNVKPIDDIRTLSGTWPDDDDDGFEEMIDELRHKNERISDEQLRQERERITIISKGLKDLRYGIFQDQQAVNDLLDKLIMLAEDTKLPCDCPAEVLNDLVDALE